MVLTMFKCVEQVTGKGRTESNYMKEKINKKFNMAEDLMSTVIKRVIMSIGN